MKPQPFHLIAVAHQKNARSSTEMSMSNLSDLEALGPDSRVWLYAFTETLTPQQEAVVRQAFDNFTSGWSSHGSGIRGAYTLLESKVVVLAMEEDQEISGCSIDSSVAVLKDLKSQHGLDALDGGLVHYKGSDGEYRACSRLAFNGLCKQGEISADTIVVNLLYQGLGELRSSGGPILPLENSWHAKAFKLPVS